MLVFPPQEDQDAGLSVGQRKRVKLSSSTKGECNDSMIDLLTFKSPVCLSKAVPCLLLDPCIIETLKHKCFLEELLFWTIKYEFPQKMVTFLLNMLPDQDYKVPIVHLSHRKVFFFCGFRFPSFCVCAHIGRRNSISSANAHTLADASVLERLRLPMYAQYYGNTIGNAACHFRRRRQTKASLNAAAL